MKCGCCGQDIGEFAFDAAFRLPDDVLKVEANERAVRVQATPDLCRLDDRYFLRGVACLPVVGSDQQFGWGIWVEIPSEQFFDYVDNYDRDNSGKPPFEGNVANKVPYYENTLGIKTWVQLGDESKRPNFEISEDGHPLTIEQKVGIELRRVHLFNGTVNRT